MRHPCFAEMDTSPFKNNPQGLNSFQGLSRALWDHPRNRGQGEGVRAGVWVLWDCSRLPCLHYGQVLEEKTQALVLALLLTLVWPWHLGQRTAPPPPPQFPLLSKEDNESTLSLNCTDDSRRYTSYPFHYPPSNPRRTGRVSPLPQRRRLRLTGTACPEAPKQGSARETVLALSLC